MLESDRKLQLFATRVTYGTRLHCITSPLFHGLQCFLRSWQYTVEVLTEVMLKIQVSWVVTLR